MKSLNLIPFCNLTLDFFVQISYVFCSIFQEVKKSRILLGKAGLIKEEEEDQDDEEVGTLTVQIETVVHLRCLLKIRLPIHFSSAFMRNAEKY